MSQTTSQQIADEIARFYNDVNVNSLSKLRNRIRGDGEVEQHGTIHHKIGSGWVVSLPQGAIATMGKENWYHTSALTQKYDISTPAKLHSTIETFLHKSEGVLLAEPESGLAYKLRRIIPDRNIVNHWPTSEYSSRVPANYKLTEQDGELLYEQLGTKSLSAIETAVLVPKSEVFVVSNTAVGQHGVGSYSGFKEGKLVFNTQVTGSMRNPKLSFDIYHNGPLSAPLNVPYTPGMRIPYSKKSSSDVNALQTAA